VKFQLVLKLIPIRMLPSNGHGHVINTVTIIIFLDRLTIPMEKGAY
jgi:hypothetical protein